MGKRFAIVIGVVAVGVMALGAQAATSTTGERGGDLVPPNLHLSGDKTQNPQADTFCDRGHCNVHVSVSCGHQRCTVRARGRLTLVNNDKLAPDIPRVVEAGETQRNVGPSLREPRQIKRVREAVNNGKTVLAKVTVRAKDAAGNTATAKRTIRLVK